MARRAQRPVGIRRHGAGWQARVYVAGIGRVSKTFPLSTPLADIAAWQDDERHRLHVDARQTNRPIQRGTFADDARRYLEAVAAMPDIARRTKDIALWVDRFGDRRRSTISSAEIRTVRDQWLTVGPKHVYVKGKGWIAKPIPLSGSTVNHRLRALSNLWTVLDGRRAPNPVRDVPEAGETPQLPRALSDDFTVIEQILDALPDRGRGERHKRRSDVSLTKLRLRVMAWTGLSPSQLMKLTPAQVDLERGTLRTAVRLKGKGVQPGLIPLLPQAVIALRAFIAAKAWGPFSTSSMRQSFRLALAKVRETGIDLPMDARPYDLRHTFASAVFRDSGNLHAVGELLQHADPRTTRRYLLAALSPVLQRTLAQMQPAKPREGGPTKWGSGDKP